MNLKEIEYIQICTEELVLAIPSTHPARKNAVWDKTGRYPELSIEEVRKIFPAVRLDAPGSIQPLIHSQVESQSQIYNT